MIVARDFFLPGRLTFCIVVLSLIVLQAEGRNSFMSPLVLRPIFYPSDLRGHGKNGKKVCESGSVQFGRSKDQHRCEINSVVEKNFVEKKTFVRNLWTRRDVLWTVENWIRRQFKWNSRIIESVVVALELNTCFVVFEIEDFNDAIDKRRCRI